MVVLNETFIFCRILKPLDKSFDIPYEFTDYGRFEIPVLLR
jgi:hypothetical protein